jgi:hypothetical protein
MDLGSLFGLLTARRSGKKGLYEPWIGDGICLRGDDPMIHLWVCILCTNTKYDYNFGVQYKFNLECFY